MDTNTELPHFFWGSADPDQYALYSPAVNRIVAVDSSDAILEYICFLLSSKINLFILPLHKARNFRPNLLDNSCCLNWGIGQHTQSDKRLTPKLLLTKGAYYHHYCAMLRQQSPAPADLLDLQKLGMLAWHVIKFFRFTENVMYNKFRDMVITPFTSTKFDLIRQQEKQCYELLYLGQSYDSIAPQIQNILQCCDLPLTTDD